MEFYYNNCVCAWIGMFSIWQVMGFKGCKHLKNRRFDFALSFSLFAFCSTNMSNDFSLLETILYIPSAGRLHHIELCKHLYWYLMHKVSIYWIIIWRDCRMPFKISELSINIYFKMHPLIKTLPTSWRKECLKMINIIVLVT